jgi:hypothetical protein
VGKKFYLSHVAGAIAVRGVDSADAFEDVAEEAEYFVSFQAFRG